MLLWFFSPFLLYFGCFRLKSKQISNETYERGRERERKKIPVIKYFIYSIHKLSIDVYIWERILIFTFFLVTNLNIFQEKKCFQVYSEQSKREKNFFHIWWLIKTKTTTTTIIIILWKEFCEKPKKEKKCWCWSNHFQFHFNQSESIDSIDWLIGIELKSNMNIFFRKCCCKKWNIN